MIDQEQLYERYQLLLHHVLHQFHLSVHHQDYDDYFQDLYIELVRIAEAFNGDPLSDTDRYRFTQYALRGLRWYLGHALEQAHQQRANQCSLDAGTPLRICTAPASPEAVTQLSRLLTESECYFLDVAQDPTLKVAEKIRELHVGRRSYYRMCRRIRRKLERIGYSA